MTKKPVGKADVSEESIDVGEDMADGAEDEEIEAPDQVGACVYYMLVSDKITLDCKD